jgi:poly(3-hydroxyalkanoate) synthetase
LPVFIDFVRNETGQSKISYMGHSQGTTMMFGALALNEEFWAERINLFIAAAPVLMPNRNSKLFTSSSSINSILYKAIVAVGGQELFGKTQ